MSAATAIGVLGSIGALVLVGSAIVAHRRRGAPVVRYAMMWGAILIAAFAIAWLAETSASLHSAR